MIDFVILTIILLFLESWHDWRMAKNYFIDIVIAKERFGWDKDYEQRTKIIKAGIIGLCLLYVSYQIDWDCSWVYTGLRFLLFDVFYYSFILPLEHNQDESTDFRKKLPVRLITRLRQLRQNKLPMRQVQ